MEPTQSFVMFQTAETLHKTVHDLLIGTAAPLTSCEQQLWIRYEWAKARLDQQSRTLK